MISVLDIVEDTMVDGPGFRTSVYCAGCPNACPGCHNPQSWDIRNGTMMSTADIMRVITADPFANVTFSGGDPMFQAEGFTELARAIRRETHKTIWCFTGFTFEYLLRQKTQRALLELLDVLVDGPFIKSLDRCSGIVEGWKGHLFIPDASSRRRKLSPHDGLMIE